MSNDISVLMMALGYRALCLPVLMMVLPCSIVTILLSGGGSREPVRAEMPRMASTIRLCKSLGVAGSERRRASSSC